MCGFIFVTDKLYSKVDSLMCLLDSIDSRFVALEVLHLERPDADKAEAGYLPFPAISS